MILFCLWPASDPSMVKDKWKHPCCCTVGMVKDKCKYRCWPGKGFKRRRKAQPKSWLGCFTKMLTTIVSFVWGLLGLWQSEFTCFTLASNHTSSSEFKITQVPECAPKAVQKGGTRRKKKKKCHRHLQSKENFNFYCRCWRYLDAGRICLWQQPATVFWEHANPFAVLNIKQVLQVTAALCILGSLQR